MYTKRNITILALLSLAASLFISCSSEPKIPDEAPTHEYKSTQKDPEPEKEEAPQTETGAASVPTATGPIATVNGEPVPAKNFNTVINSLLARGVPASQISGMKDSIINGVVNDFILQKKVDGLTYPIPDALFNERLDELKELVKQSAPVPDDQVMGVLAQQLGIAEEDIEKQIKQAIQLEIELEKKGYLKPISDSEIKAFYDENPQVSEQPELVSARHILLTVPENASDADWEKRRKEALDISKQARKKGADFAKLAEKLSEGPTAKNGGNLGTFPRGLMVPEFEEAVFKLKEGEVSDPVRTKFGWHVILAEKHSPERKVPLPELEKKIRSRLRRAKTSELLVKYLEDRRAEHDIKLLPENVK